MSVEERISLAKSSKDPEILAKLADDESMFVREVVAQYTDDPEILEKLRHDEEERVRYSAIVINSILREEREENPPKQMPKKSHRAKSSWPSSDWWYDLDDESFEDAWQEYLSAPESEVNDELQIFSEPSVQGSMGGLFVYDESGEDRKGEGEDWYIDWQEYLDWQIDAAATSKNASQYKKKYRKFMKDLCGI